MQVAEVRVRLVEHKGPVVDLAKTAVASGLCDSVSEAKRLIRDGGLWLDDVKVRDMDGLVRIGDRFYSMERGARRDRSVGALRQW